MSVWLIVSGSLSDNLSNSLSIDLSVCLSACLSFSLAILVLFTFSLEAQKINLISELKCDCVCVCVCVCVKLVSNKLKRVKTTN